MADCAAEIMSEEYGDFIWEYRGNRQEMYERYRDRCLQFIDYRYACDYERLEDIPPVNMENYPYASIPKLYGLMDITAPAAVGSVRLQNQTGFQLDGSGVIVGFIDTGIDYTNHLFMGRTGKTRILEIWDQTDNTGEHPENFQYGSVYTGEDIDRALESDTPYDIVPHRDTNGHGTFVAGVACGRYMVQEDFAGTAPASDIVMVKLKPAKEYLKDFFMIETQREVYQENDIMLAVAYLMDLRMRYDRPLVIVLGVGSGSGDRTGGSPLAQLLGDMGQTIGNCVVVCSGNEGNERLHYSGTMENGQWEDVELRVGTDNKGFVLELWGNSPDVFSVSFISPAGESVPKIPARKDGYTRTNFLLDNTTIETYYAMVESGAGNQLVFIRFINPSEGIWIVRVYGNNILHGRYNIWGNLRQFTKEDTYFLKPDPDDTITVPGNGDNIITVGGYDHYTDAFYPASGRGYLKDANGKPDFVAPAVNVSGPGIRSEYTAKTGTSVGAALTAGCCAQMLQWGIVEENEIYMKTNYIKNYLIRGAVRNRDIKYPDSRWGYGIVNVYDAFAILTAT